MIFSINFVFLLWYVEKFIFIFLQEEELTNLTNIHVKSTCLHSDSSSGRSAVGSTVSLNLHLLLSGFLLAVMVIIIVDMSSAHFLSL